MKIPHGSQRVICFYAGSWPQSVYRPMYGAEYDEREPRPAQRLELEAFRREATWVMTLAGEAIYEEGAHRTRLFPGSVLYVERPTRGVIIHPPAGGRWHHIWLTLAGEPALEFGRMICRVYGRVHCVPKRARSIKSARALLKMAEKNDTRDARDWSIATFAWLNDWWRDAETESAPVLSGLAKQADSKVVSLATGSLKKMAYMLGYSDSHLRRKLKRVWDGQAPGRQMRKFRMQRACELLHGSKLTVEAIAQEVGYSSSASFIEAFKKYHGITPLRYRHREGEVPLAG